ncbi:MAG: FHA domain-containing protein [Oscillospiraceae bacterium]|nr:FHA domain-containing protein [Oscillospiraceae bacterium]
MAKKKGCGNMRNYIREEGKNRILCMEAENTGTDTVAKGMLESNEIGGLIPFSVMRFDSTVTAEYNISGYMSLSELVKEKLTDKDIRSLLSSVLCSYEEAGEYMIKPERIIFESEMMFYDRNSGKLHLCVYPFTDRIQYSLKEFLKDFICGLRFDVSEDCSCIGRMLGYLNSCEEFSSDDFRNILFSENETLKSAAASDSAVTADNTYMTVYDADRYNETEPSSEKTVKNSENRISVSLDAFADDEEYEDNDSGGFLSRIFGSFKLSGKKNSEKSLLNSRITDTDEDFLIPDSINETILLSEKNEGSRPHLIRMSSNEIIELSGNSFRIGSDNDSVDYCISDNCAVSRVHAEIKRKGGCFFIADNHSTNSTYVDNQEVKGKKEVKLINRCRIMLADEEFMFCSC